VVFEEEEEGDEEGDATVILRCPLVVNTMLTQTVFTG